MYTVLMLVDRGFTESEQSALSAADPVLEARNDSAFGHGFVHARITEGRIGDAGRRVGDVVRAVIGEGHITAVHVHRERTAD